MNKGTVLFLGFVVVVCGFAFREWQRKEDLGNQEITEHRPVLWSWGDIKALKLVSKKQELAFWKENQRWWMQPAKKYPANEDILRMHFQMMSRVLADEVFPLEEDRFGFENPRGEIHLVHQDGRQFDLVLGGETAPGGKVYVKNKKQSIVYVVHQGWAQFFLQDIQAFYYPGLFFEETPSEIVFRKGDREEWKLISDHKQNWQFRSAEKNKSIGTQEMFSIWKEFKKMNFENFKESPSVPFSKAHQFEFKVGEEWVKIFVDHQFNGVYQPQFGMKAQVVKDQLSKIMTLIEGV